MPAAVKGSAPTPSYCSTVAEVEPRLFPWPEAGLRARLRADLADFQVREELPFLPSGSGSHCWLEIEKRGLNTEQVAQRLARLAGVAARDVGFAGLKDRWAVARQVFTVPVGADKTCTWASLNDENLQILSQRRHDKKLRRGVLRGNHFHLVLREVVGDQALWEERLTAVAQEGFPNYFGEQRFGHGNIDKAGRLLAGASRGMGRHERGLLWSAARSVLFNMVLAARVRQGGWSQLLPGDVVQLDGSHSHFRAEDEELPTLVERAAAWDLHPTGPLPGRGGIRPGGAALQVEEGALAAWRGGAALPESGLHWAQCLAAQGLDAGRRPLRVRPQGLTWTWPDAATLELDFFLPAGSFATVLVETLLGQ
uniref:tRNA pseudouridine synthase D n=1 Tax=Acidithiobacillus sulfuriphilus TaxID=1867749 RepID=A0A3M8QWS1_9PROT|nr:tRNA pseudouridine(13) synthase TruD [Acidithiobacillus sulfuriphilus]